MLRDGGTIESTNRFIRIQYKKYCLMLRLEYNTIVNVVGRLEKDRQFISQIAEDNKKSTSNGWNYCGMEKLATISRHIFSLLNQYSIFADVHTVVNLNSKN